MQLKFSSLESHKHIVQSWELFKSLVLLAIDTRIHKKAITFTNIKMWNFNLDEKWTLTLWLKIQYLEKENKHSEKPITTNIHKRGWWEDTLPRETKPTIVLNAKENKNLKSKTKRVSISPCQAKNEVNSTRLGYFNICISAWLISIPYSTRANHRYVLKKCLHGCIYHRAL